jgi:cell wall-associated NlpC family hydrolase
MSMARLLRLRGPLLALVLALLAGCAGPPSLPEPAGGYTTVAGRDQGREVAMYAFGLVDAGYRFGGRNPDSGLDCSGMVAYIYEQVTGARLPHSAREIARLARPVSRTELQPGDLVFFNTRNRPYSHVGIFVGDGRFVHAPRRNDRVRVSRLDEDYFARRFDSARSLLRD